MKPTAEVMRLEFLLCLDVVCVCGGWGGDLVGGTPWLWAGAFDVCLH